jgi:mono/diheme cytochrome c family protein
MPTFPPQTLTERKILFGVLLLIIAGALIYVLIENRPWSVPEEAKRRKNPVPASDTSLQAIRQIYLDKCAVCHGDSGRGDGHDAKLYNPQPTAFADAKSIDAVTDGELFYKLSEGRRPMPSFKKRLSEEQRWQLVLLIRSFSKP